MTNICIYFLKTQEATCSNFQIGWLFFSLLEYLYENIFIFYSALDKSIWPLRHLAFKKLLSLEGFDARQGMYLDQPCRSKVQQPNVHEHTDKLSERHVKNSPDPLQCSLLQHGSFQVTSSFRRDEVELGGWWPSGSAAYQEFLSLHQEGTTLQQMRTSQISATLVNCDPHSRR